MKDVYRTPDRGAAKRLRTRWVRIVLSRKWRWLPFLITSVLGLALMWSSTYYWKVRRAGPCASSVEWVSYHEKRECDPPKTLKFDANGGGVLVQCQCP